MKKKRMPLAKLHVQSFATTQVHGGYYETFDCNTYQCTINYTGICICFYTGIVDGCEGGNDNTNDIFICSP